MKITPLLWLALTVSLTLVATVSGQDNSTIAGPPTTADYATDGPVKIRFSSYAERDFPGAETKRFQDGRFDYVRSQEPAGPLLLNVPKGGRSGSYVEKLAKIDADEGFVYVPGETVKIHVTVSGAPAEVTVSGQLMGRGKTFTVSGTQTLDWPLAAAGGKDDFELYQVEARQGGRVVARRGFLAQLPTGDIVPIRDTRGTLGWEFIEWGCSPFDYLCGFPVAERDQYTPKQFNRNHMMGGRFDPRLEPWNWVTNTFAPDMPIYGVRVSDWSRDLFAQPYTEYPYWWQYFGAGLQWRADSWRWGEFNEFDLERSLVGINNQHKRGEAWGTGAPAWPSSPYAAANDGLLANGAHFREWLAALYYVAQKKLCEMRPGIKTILAEADHWNERDNGPSPIHPRIIQTYLDYLRAKNLPHDDLDAAKNSAELAALLQPRQPTPRGQHFRYWNSYQINLRGRQYIWEASVKAGMEVNGWTKVDWRFGNGLMGETIGFVGQGWYNFVTRDLEIESAPWVRYAADTGWDYHHWLSGNYRFPAQSFARAGALYGIRILNQDAYNESPPHLRPDHFNLFHTVIFKENWWYVPRTAAEHGRMFIPTSFMHYYDNNGKVQRVVNWDLDDIYRSSQASTIGGGDEHTPGPELHAILDHRQVSEGVTMERPLGFVGVISSARTADLARGTEFLFNMLPGFTNVAPWDWFFESLADFGVSIPAYVDADNLDLLPPDANLIFAPRKDGKGHAIISARVAGKLITAPWQPGDRAVIARFAADIQAAAGEPVTFSAGATGFALTFRNNRALVFVENKRNEYVANSPSTRDNTVNPPDEQPRDATVSVVVPFAARGAQVWDLTGFLPVPNARVSGDRVTFTAKLRAGDGRLYAVVSPAGAPKLPPLRIPPPRPAQAELGKFIVPWMDTAYEKVAYRNAILADQPKPYAPRNYTMLAEVAPSAPAPARVAKSPSASLQLTGGAPILKHIAPAAAIVIGDQAPAAVRDAAEKLSVVLKKNGGAGKIFTAAEFQALPVNDSGAWHLIAIGTVWDNELLQRFNDPWTLDRDWYYGRLGNEPAWDWMPRGGYTVGFVGDFAADDDGVGNVVVDRSSFMWEARCRAIDDENKPEDQRPLRLIFRLTGSGVAGVLKAVKAFADAGLLNGTIAGQRAPSGEARYTLTPERLYDTLPLTVPLTVNTADGHTLTYLGWNQPDAEFYDSFYSKTGIPAQKIYRVKYVPEWGLTNFAAAPHRGSTRYEVCVLDFATPAAAEAAVEKLAADSNREPLTIGHAAARQAKYGALIVAQGHRVITESAPAPWGQALLEEFLKGNPAPTTP
ncbi:MAG: hypothetical protein LBK71_03620 [Verrucomicrobiales bacterium]|jgi:hypothetical protein|nr:hypothetical protein [Verrucomicrobiales bacterium]